MRNKTFIGWSSEWGGSPLANSIAVIPNDQMSAYKKTNKQKNKSRNKIFFLIFSWMPTPIISKTRNVAAAQIKEGNFWPSSHRQTALWLQVPSKKVCQQMCCVWSGCLSVGPPLQSPPASRHLALTATRWQLSTQRRMYQIRSTHNMDQKVAKMSYLGTRIAAITQSQHIIGEKRDQKGKPHPDDW